MLTNRADKEGGPMNTQLTIEETDELRERIEEAGLLAHEVLCRNLDLEEEVVFPVYLYDSGESREEI